MPKAKTPETPDDSKKFRLGRPPVRGPRANVTMSWDLDLIAVVNAFSEVSGLSRNVIVDEALRAYLAAKQREEGQS